MWLNPHHIPWNKEEKTNVQGVVAYIKSVIVPLHFKPWPLPTFTPINLVSIIIYMGMMQNIVSHCTQSWNRANHKPPMLVKTKVLKKAKKGYVWSTKGHPLSQLQAIQHHGGHICIIESLNYEHGGLGVPTWTNTHKCINWPFCLNNGLQIFMYFNQSIFFSFWSMNFLLGPFFS